MTSGTGRLLSGQFTALAIVIEDEGIRTLRIVVPLGVQLVHGTRILIDSQKTIQRPYVGCYAEGGCYADYKMDVDLLQSLRTGRTLTIQAINGNGAPVTIPIALVDFEKAYTGTPVEWSSLDGKVRSSQEALLALKGKGSGEDIGNLAYGPWKKMCLKSKEAASEVCFTGKDGRAPSGAPQISVAVIEPRGDPKRLLRITLSLAQQLTAGVSLSIDARTFRVPFIICQVNACMADLDVTSLIDTLKRGQILKVQATNRAGLPIERSLPLSDFKAAYEGGGSRHVGGAPRYKAAEKMIE